MSFATRVTCQLVLQMLFHSFQTCICAWPLLMMIGHLIGEIPLSILADKYDFLMIKVAIPDQAIVGWFGHGVIKAILPTPQNHD